MSTSVTYTFLDARTLVPSEICVSSEVSSSSEKSPDPGDSEKSPSDASSSASSNSPASASASASALPARRRLIRLLLPTPDGPASTVTRVRFRSTASIPVSSASSKSSSSDARAFLLARSASSSSTPSPVATETNQGLYPHCSKRAAQSARVVSLTKSHLFSTKSNGTSVCSMETKNRVSCFASSGGRSNANTSNARSTLAIGGSINLDRRRSTSYTNARLPTQSMPVNVTSSPTKTKRLIFFNNARATHKSSYGPFTSSMSALNAFTSSVLPASSALSCASRSCASRFAIWEGDMSRGCTTTRRKLAWLVTTTPEADASGEDDDAADASSDAAAEHLTARCGTRRCGTRAGSVHARGRSAKGPRAAACAHRVAEGPASACAGMSCAALADGHAPGALFDARLARRQQTGDAFAVELGAPRRSARHKSCLALSPRSPWRMYRRRGRRPTRTRVRRSQGRGEGRDVDAK
mmetsp:Transcript_5465/g.22127  ORF Transcript_5465/g.22127 Transcript_5465/m.22127 type:complete len:468 (-) Transcript_5465:22-1425(-)